MPGVRVENASYHDTPLVLAIKVAVATAAPEHVDVTSFTLSTVVSVSLPWAKAIVAPAPIVGLAGTTVKVGGRTAHVSDTSSRYTALLKPTVLMALKPTPDGKDWAVSLLTPSTDTAYWYVAQLNVSTTRYHVLEAMLASALPLPTVMPKFPPMVTLMVWVAPRRSVT